ncbi:MAG: short-chain fatty acid transporter [Lautropia sp.]|nr:short-chain fatty acid transporter [Lautropia sp.]
MFQALTRFSVRLVERYLPDPYIFVVILTLIAGGSAVLFQSKAPGDVVRIWGDGFWGLLPFTMQMVLVLVTGFMLASTGPVRWLLSRIARLARTPGQAIVLVTVVSLVANWINWGFGLVVGAIFAKEMARQVRADYRLLVASAYSGFLVWHAGLAGSVPVTIATPGHFAADRIGVIPTSETIFSSFNLMILAMLFVAVPLLNRLMMPAQDDCVIVDPEKLKEAEPDDEVSQPTFASWIERSWLLTALIGVAGLAYAFDYYVVKQGGINLNIINFSFLFLAIILHGTPRRMLNSLQEAIRGTGGIVLQFPFYAGIMAIMTQTGLAASVSNWMISFASAESLPFWTFISAGLVNMFVPSGGGQWAVQAPLVIEATQALGADITRTTMAVAWGDAWTNMLQPFWALPVLAIAGLKAKDIMGFCLMQLLLSGVLISLGLVFL